MYLAKTTRKGDGSIIMKKKLIAHYKFSNQTNIALDYSGNNMNGIALGTNPPEIKEIGGRMAAVFSGGAHKTSYIKLPENLLSDVSDMTGFTMTAWINLSGIHSVWERIIDLGKGPGGPYIFLTRNLRGVAFAGSDLAADPAKALPNGQWIHIAFTISGTKGGTLSSAGPIIYINGEIASDGSISQTSSGNYGKLRQFFETFKEPSNYKNNFIGLSQYDVDADFSGAISEMRFYSDVLTEDEIIEEMCETLTDEDIIDLARDKYLPELPRIAVTDLSLPSTLLGENVNVTWISDNPSAMSSDGKILEIHSASAVNLTATITRGSISDSKTYNFTVLPKELPPYTLTVNGNDETVKISDTLWGLFYEDINNAADGGIYAELIQNRSFEAFNYNVYDPRSGEDGKSDGRNRNPLFAWFGDTDKMTPKFEGGLNEYFGVADKKDVNECYVEVADGATIYNRGFCDSNRYCSMYIKEGERYEFSIWAKSKESSKIKLMLVDVNDNPVSSEAEVLVSEDTWKKYGRESKIYLECTKSGYAQLKLMFTGNISIDFVSLFPENVWGATPEASSKTAHSNYMGNSNYRLRRDLVESLIELHPTFLRFPGGCISEGSFIWEDVYDWKDSVGDVETRKENFNCWGYVMTMGLGYMEYFQLAEDLGATPLPVMACGVLCQARSNYANAAGGKLREKYIKNFTDLIDFAISTDFENNEWAKVRKMMGHEAPFDLHLLGIGNENWEPKFMANFEAFYKDIMDHVHTNYPGYDLTIVSTAGAQADDNAYKEDWNFLLGKNKGSATLRFTDGEKSFDETVSWYNNKSDYLDTIADEHYYRPNHYLLNNADRYNYYYRAYNNDGSINEDKISKVFVGEYASTDKNTLAGAIAEAAIMTSFENNSDVVRLAATAPLFNKILTDGTYRWTPDCIWFDNETVWYTPTYYVQQLFAKYIGKNAVSTSFSTYENGRAIPLIPRGGIEIATGNADILVKSAKVVSNTDGKILGEYDFTTMDKETLEKEFDYIGNSANISLSDEGLKLTAGNGLTGIYHNAHDWTNYTIMVNALKLSGVDGFYVGVGVTRALTDKKNALEYAIGLDGNCTGLKVYKNGIEGYTLGDFSSSRCAGNMRAAMFEELKDNTEYAITVNYGGWNGKNIICNYEACDGSFISKPLDYKLEAYNKDVFNSVTKDENNFYMKLVNADNFEKSLKVIINDVNIASEAKVVTITAAPEFVHVPNVNVKNNEIVVPKESSVSFSNGEAIITLPANSVVAVIADIV